MSRTSRIRRWYHQKRGHKVVTTVVRDYREVGGGRLDFYFRPGFICVDCQTIWPR